MKLHYSKMLLFVIPLNILLTSYHMNNKNKPSITPHHTQTNRSLCECVTQSSIYDKEADIKSVMQQFDDRTSQRFEEYEERMKEKRQKRKEERDKNIEQIIKKDKMEKNLAEKVEKGCLRCGCGLGCGVLPVWGLVSGLWYATWSQYVTQTAMQKGIEEGIAKAIQEVITQFSLKTLGGEALEAVITSKTYNQPMFFVGKIMNEYYTTCESGTLSSHSFCTSIQRNVPNSSGNAVQIINERVIDVATKAGNAAKTVQADEIARITAESSQLFSAIGYSVLAILIIVLVMIIIYLILRHRRKKKINKKAQYTKLLNE
ncbi:rifin PIR protein, putative [Plasmodium reichenowi]|uniref:Rifin PIR protein, putative n=1 Tax=Plasmodium reichenowi TaxID=5854 RepID=A0A2P9DS86_PLARE|nr:rifin PIR protein, putative [Plasmodium reichenowi]